MCYPFSEEDYWQLFSHYHLADCERRIIQLRRTKLHTFLPHKDMESIPGWVISSVPEPPPRQRKYERRCTPGTHPFILTRRIWNDDYGGQIIFGDIVGLKFPDIYLTDEKTCPNRGIEPGPDAWEARKLPPVPFSLSNNYYHLITRNLK